MLHSSVNEPWHSVQISIAASLGGLFFLTLLFCAYQLWFHPLARYPGPFLAKFTRLYAGWHAWKGDLHIDMQRCHEKYGNYVRYSPNALLLNTSTGLHDVYGYKSNTQKSQLYNAMVHRAPNTLTLINKKAHGRKRRIISQGLSDAALRRYQPAILKHVNELCSVLVGSDVKQWSIAHNMAHFCNYLTFDIMSDVLFGEEYNTVTKDEHRFVVKAIEESNVRTSVLSQAPILTFRRLDRWLFAKSIQGRNKFIQFVNKLLQSRFKSAKSTRQDVFTFLMDAKDPETQQSLTLAEIGAETTTLVVAGSDTTSTALASTIFYLSHDPKWYNVVAGEVRAAFSSVDQITLGTTLSSCVYLRACIDESMRMSPPAGSALWREVGKGGGVFDEQHVPEGYDVGTGVYAIHHNPEYYPEPFKFRPERWILAGSDQGGLGTATRESLTAVHNAYTPFSIGPRSCIGKGLAITELTLALATILYRFDLSLGGSNEEMRVGEGAPGLEPGRHRTNEYQLYDHITASKDGPMIRFRKRDMA
ncbi:cytochrome P450, putative [Talaromyces stipitatus ATCC 10500]|uniref:Cytochrome P450, putative n=1 Tax=Talaromyces stipitatus (strain ATCC 10500 / CBS 375.48 / QM 6759 / NRRL 1006) TaxID=441959 RepID=B8LZT5_TALSN|nr:cytochrome P450, putative [Talaromyces stipitatus ATCC 10500]EED20867.1 cytochrome P450, putative [Talaromyces stipitatus ATCC 10500]